MLILDQSDADSSWYASFSAAFRSTLNAGPAKRISVYAEHLDLSRFRGPKHEDLLRSYLRDKFRATPIGLIVAQGSSSLDFVMRSRAELWPGVPVMFAGVDEETGKGLSLPPDVTGNLYQRTFRNTVATAQMLVPSLKRIALVGDPWEHQAVRRHYREEIPAFAGEFEFIYLLDLPMTEIRKRVAVLPDDTAIIYTSVTRDGAGTIYVPHEGLAAFAEAANRPIVVDVETNIGHGGAGGFIPLLFPLARLRHDSRCASSMAKISRAFLYHRRFHQARVRLAAAPTIWNQREQAAAGKRDPLSPTEPVGAASYSGAWSSRSIRIADGNSDHPVAADAQAPPG